MTASQNDVAMHPPSRAATGGQAHHHRPVSAMPTPSTRVHQGSSRNGTSAADFDAVTYNERRASAHPTVPNTSQSTNAMMGPPLTPNVTAASIDPATSQAINQGIPITSPAALQYFAAHPRRQQVHFGNYLLLQTLGEGEFGKVKLGVHKEFGEEVAVKLIKRDKVGTADGQLQLSEPAKDPSKMSKVEKEIRVLKDVRHPNIVRLYEVIESDRYIGIVLEYASGGELFDHILAHKYLKERDACRLFAQLISGVSYLHQKKIVHRDLKLENLLLDRNRNVIITDFGFANNFESRMDDLMATSCGSPCYAAPELVVQDGLYAGSAVDVWSCGVILYAMLAGYLPFDDDPANPDGDNINLLYKYIMATPLSFPDYITAQPRDLLSRMLVPDPLKRADLQDVMSHSWLMPYRDLFRFSVEDLERAAMEQQNKKRQVYRQQMIVQQQIQEQQQSGGRGQGVNASVKQQRHQSAMAASSTVPDRMMETSYSMTSGRSRPVTALPAPQEGVAQTIYAGHPTSATVTNLSSEASNASADMIRGGQSNDDSSTATKKSAGSKTQRHTVQLEYDSAPPRRQDSVSEASRSAENGTRISETAKPVINVARRESILEDEPTKTDKAGSARITQIPAAPVSIGDGITKAPRRSSKASEQSAVPPTPSKDGEKQAVTTPPSTTQTRRRSAAPRSSSNPVPARAASDSTQISSSGVGTEKEATKTAITDTDSVQAKEERERKAKAERAQARHRKGMSTDKFFLSKLLGSPSTAVSHTDVLQQVNGTTKSQERNKQNNASVNAIREEPAALLEPIGRRTSSARRKTMSLVVGRAQNSPEKEREKALKAERRLTARLRKDTLPKENKAPETPKRPATASRAEKLSPSGASMLTETPGRTPTFKRGGGQVPFGDNGLNESTSTVGASSNAAKKVMDWFRKKSMSRGQFDEKMPLDTPDVNASPISRRKENGTTVSDPKKIDDTPPQVIVTSDTSGTIDEQSGPSSRSTSGTHETHSTSATSAVPEPAILKSSTSTVNKQQTPRASVTQLQQKPAAPAIVPDSALRVHQGAVDQSALTSRTPNDVFAQVQRALWQMGVDVKTDSDEEFKLECVRRKRAKTLMGATQNIGQSIRSSVFPPSQADYERSATLASGRMPSSPSTMLSPSQSSVRSFLRRGSGQNASSAGNDEQAPAPLYGEASVDGGQEVRFSVEVTRIKNLPGLYSVDIRRLKGNLWAYKFIYHALLERCELSRDVVATRG